MRTKKRIISLYDRNLKLTSHSVDGDGCMHFVLNVAC